MFSLIYIFTGCVQGFLLLQHSQRMELYKEHSECLVKILQVNKTNILWSLFLPKHKSCSCCSKVDGFKIPSRGLCHRITWEMGFWAWDSLDYRNYSCKSCLPSARDLGFCMSEENKLSNAMLAFTCFSLLIHQRYNKTSCFKLLSLWFLFHGGR